LTTSRANPISCHLITWRDDLETGMREASGLGFQACETFTHLALAHADDPDAFRALLAGEGLRLSALYAGARFSDAVTAGETIAEIERIARFLAALGVDRIVLGPGGPRTGPSTPEMLKQACQTIEEAARRTAALGVHACVHPHLGTEIQDRAEIDAIMAGTDPELVGFCPDTAHLTGAGMDPVDLIRVYGRRIGYVHLKDIGDDAPVGPDLNSSGTDAMTFFCELGRGSVDFPAVLAALRDVGYTGWMTVEIDSTTTTPLESLTICRDYLVEQLGTTLQA
jgi:inosose dehydratase